MLCDAGKTAMQNVKLRKVLNVEMKINPFNTLEAHLQNVYKINPLTIPVIHREPAKMNMPSRGKKNQKPLPSSEIKATALCNVCPKKT